MNYRLTNNLGKTATITSTFKNVLEKHTRTSSKYHSTSTNSTNPRSEQRNKFPSLGIDPKALNDYLALSLILEPQSLKSHSIFDKILADKLKQVLTKNLLDELSKTLLRNIVNKLDINQMVKEACDISSNQDYHCQKPSPLEVEENEQKNPSVGSKTRKVNKCEHKDRPHYAKSLCKNCYHKEGRQKVAFKCEHFDRPLYAFGICKQCYQSRYSKIRTCKIKNKQKGQSPGNEAIETIRKVNSNIHDVTKNENYISNDFHQMCENFSFEVERNDSLLDKINYRCQNADLALNINNISMCGSKNDQSKSNVTDLRINDNELNQIEKFEDNSFMNNQEKSDSVISNYSDYLL